MSEARQYLVEQATNPTSREDEDVRETAQALLVMFDAGILEASREEASGEFLFTYKTDVSEEQVNAAQTAFEALGECDDDALETFYKGASN